MCNDVNLDKNWMQNKERKRVTEREKVVIDCVLLSSFLALKREIEREENVKMMRDREAITELHRNWFGGLSCTLPTYLGTFFYFVTFLLALAPPPPTIK